MKKASHTSVRSRAVRQVALLCLLLMTCVTFAEATHVHSFASPQPEGRCDFCLAVHANAAAVPVASAAVVLDLAPTLVLHLEDCTAATLLHASDLYIRPPPLV